MVDSVCARVGPPPSSEDRIEALEGHAEAQAAQIKALQAAVDAAEDRAKRLVTDLDDAFREREREAQADDDRVTAVTTGLVLAGAIMQGIAAVALTWLSMAAA